MYSSALEYISLPPAIVSGLGGHLLMTDFALPTIERLAISTAQKILEKMPSVEALILLPNADMGAACLIKDYLWTDKRHHVALEDKGHFKNAATSVVFDAIGDIELIKVRSLIQAPLSACIHVPENLASKIDIYADSFSKHEIVRHLYHTYYLSEEGEPERVTRSVSSHSEGDDNMREKLGRTELPREVSAA